MLRPRGLYKLTLITLKIHQQGTDNKVVKFVIKLEQQRVSERFKMRVKTYINNNNNKIVLKYNLYSYNYMPPIDSVAAIPLIFLRSDIMRTLASISEDSHKQYLTHVS